MADKLRYEQGGHIVLLTLNKPEARSPLSGHDLCETL